MREIGICGEEIAEKYLLRKRYRIIKKNFRCKLGEIDLIVEKKGVIIFVEVKTRTTLDYGEPFESITTYKRNRIKRLAEYFLMNEKYQNKLVQFDVISIKLKPSGELAEFLHLQKAF